MRRLTEAGGSMPVLKLSAINALVLILSAFAPAAHAEDAFYLGAWKIDSAAIAPWADAHGANDAQKNEIVGQTVTLAPAAITGPEVLACKNPHYKISEFTLDMLFQGEFDEMHDRNKSADPHKLAASLGFTGTTIKTLETGCEVDWHFVDPRKAEIGLNDYVFTLKKQ
jgi:hypothetical protein